MTTDTQQKNRDTTRLEALATVRKRLRTEIRYLNALLQHGDHLDRVELLGLFELADHIDQVINTHSETRCAANRDRVKQGTL